MEKYAGSAIETYVLSFISITEHNCTFAATVEIHHLFKVKVDYVMNR